MRAINMEPFGAKFRTAAFALAAFGAAQSAATPASAGLLDFLFGRPQPQPVAVAPAEAASKPVRRVVRDEPRGPRPYVAPEVVAGPLGRFLRDPSLRRGDIVATPEGLMVFQGSGGSSNHKPSEFVPVANAVSIGGARRNDLLSLDRTVRASTPNIEYVAAKPEPKSMVVATRDDAKGGFIKTPSAGVDARVELAVQAE